MAVLTISLSAVMLIAEQPTEENELLTTDIQLGMLWSNPVSTFRIPTSPLSHDVKITL